MMVTMMVVDLEGGDEMRAIMLKNKGTQPQWLMGAMKAKETRDRNG